MAASQAKSGGNRKIGRDKDKCKRYFVSQKRYENKIRKAKKRYGQLPQTKLNKILATIQIERGNRKREL